MAALLLSLGLVLGLATIPPGDAMAQSPASSAAPFADEQGQVLAERIAAVTTRAIYALDKDHLRASVEAFLDERPRIKALVVTETIDNDRLLTYFRAGGKGVYGQPIPEPVLALDRFTADVVFEGERIGIVNLYMDVGGIDLTPEERDWIRGHPRIRVHNETNWPPFNFARDGKPMGLSIDVMNRVADRVGLRVDYVTGPTWNDFLGMMKTGDLDVMLNIVRTRERETYLLYTPPYGNNPNSILSRRGSRYTTLEQLAGKSVALPKGFFYEEILRKDHPHITLLLVRDVLESMKAVSYGQADAALGELAVFNYLLGEHLMTDLVVSGEVSMGRPELTLLNMATRKDLPLLASILTKGVMSLSDQELQDMKARWQKATAAQQAAGGPRMDLTPAEADWLADHKDLRLGVDPARPPYSFVDARGWHSGLAADLLDLVGDTLGLHPQPLADLTWPQVLAGARDGKVDMVALCTPPPQGDDGLMASTPVATVSLAIATRQDAASIGGLDALQGRAVLVAADRAALHLVRDAAPDLAVVAVSTPSEALRQVAAGQADAFVGDRTTMEHLIRAEALSNLEVATPPGLPTAPLSLCVRADWPELLGLVNKALAAIPDNEMKAARARWIPDHADAEAPAGPAAPSRTYGTILAFVVFSLGLLTVLSMIVYALGRLRRGEHLASYFGAAGFRSSILLGLSALVAMVAVLNWLAITDSLDRTRTRIDNQLQLVLHSSIERMALWMDDRTAYLRQLGRDPNLIGITRRLLDAPRNTDDLQHEQALDDARKFFEANGIFGQTGFQIVAPDLTTVGAGRNAALGTTNPVAVQRQDLIQRAFAGETVFVPPLSVAGPSGGRNLLTMYFATPISEPSGLVIAVLVQRVEPEGPLTQILQFARIGDSGETYAFDAQARMISDSRFMDALSGLGLTAPDGNRPDGVYLRDPGVDVTTGQAPTRPLEQRPLTVMAAGAMKRRTQGKTHEHGSLDHFGTRHPSNLDGYRDYRGVTVVGAWAWLHDMDLGLATEMDHDEAYADHFGFRRNLIAISAVTTLLAIFATLFTLFVGQRAHRTLSRARDDLEVRVEERTRELAEKELMLRSALENMPGGMVMLDRDLRLTNFNSQIQDMIGASGASMAVGKNLLDIIRQSFDTAFDDPDELERFVRQRARAILNPSESGAELPMPSGQTVLLKYSRTQDGGRIGVATDISARKEAERQLEDAYKVISDSIHYAARIQRALLPPDAFIAEDVAEHFIVWEPRDVVGGDIYWYRRCGGGFLIALADCTGHGVPGAFMTIIATGALDRAL
ncbi:MAG: transporter substrate-binding domain-containing protein, partial [Rhodobacterales bacterium]|nr:transporter substrate-binding domain-containing protein [Rhodobacterales bacterium]